MEQSSSMKTTLIGIAVIIGAIQYKLWLGQGQVQEVMALRGELNELVMKKEALTQRNQFLLNDIQALKSQNSRVESLARSELGLVKPGETYYQIVEK